MPPVTKVQAKKQALAGVMRIVPEGTLGAWYAIFLTYIHKTSTHLNTRPGDNPNQCAQGYGCPPPSLSLDNFVPFGNRYIDVGSGGPAPFTFTATSNASWLHLSPTKGSISPSNPEQRVFASVDWSKVSGAQQAMITFTAVASGQPNLVQTVGFTATHNTVPSSFKGT